MCVCGQLGGSAPEVWLAAGWGNGRWLGHRALIIPLAGSHGGLAGSPEKEWNASWAMGLNVAQNHFYCILLTRTSHEASSDLKVSQSMSDGMIENQMASRCGFGEVKIGATFIDNLPKHPSAFVSRQSPPYWNVSHPLGFVQKINSSSWRARSFQVPTSELLTAQWSHPSCLGLGLESRLLGPDYV